MGAGLPGTGTVGCEAALGTGLGAAARGGFAGTAAGRAGTAPGLAGTAAGLTCAPAGAAARAAAAVINSTRFERSTMVINPFILNEYPLLQA
jgi:hypothetical protein